MNYSLVTSFKRLASKSTAAFEIEKMLAYHTEISKNLAIKFGKEILKYFLEFKRSYSNENEETILKTIVLKG